MISLRNSTVAGLIRRSPPRNPRLWAQGPISSSSHSRSNLVNRSKNSNRSPRKPRTSTFPLYRDNVQWDRSSSGSGTNECTRRVVILGKWSTRATKVPNEAAMLLRERHVPMVSRNIEKSKRNWAVPMCSTRILDKVRLWVLRGSEVYSPGTCARLNSEWRGG